MGSGLLRALVSRNEGLGASRDLEKGVAPGARLMHEKDLRGLDQTTLQRKRT